MEFLMNKVIRRHDFGGQPFISGQPCDKVAVLVSAGYGAGWSTWATDEYREAYLFHPKLVQMVEEGRQDEITSEWMEKELEITSVYDRHRFTGGRDGLYIEWVPVGTKFIIHEYDGHESLKTIDDFYWITA
jgi:hypothetical protein